MWLSNNMLYISRNNSRKPKHQKRINNGIDSI